MPLPSACRIIQPPPPGFTQREAERRQRENLRNQLLVEGFRELVRTRDVEFHAYNTSKSHNMVRFINTYVDLAFPIERTSDD